MFPLTLIFLSYLCNVLTLTEFKTSTVTPMTKNLPNLNIFFTPITTICLFFSLYLSRTVYFCIFSHSTIISWTKNCTIQYCNFMSEGYNDKPTSKSRKKKENRLIDYSNVVFTSSTPVWGTNRMRSL